MDIKAAKHNNETLRHYLQFESITFKEGTHMMLLTVRLHIAEYRLGRAWYRRQKLLAKLNTKAEDLTFREELTRLFREELKDL